MSILQIQLDLKSFHGDQKIKDKYLRRVLGHRKADEIRQGYGYWLEGKGCAVGCTLHSSDHEAYEDELGIPRQIAYLQDAIFERLPNEDAVLFPEQFLEAIPIGVNLYPAYWKFMLWFLVDGTEGLITVTENEQVKTVINQIADLYKKALAGGDVSEDEFYKVRGDARDALDARAARAARAALDALDARAKKFRDHLLKCLSEATA